MLSLNFSLVFFVYGLAFMGMGLAILLEIGRSPSLAEAQLLVPLATFGILHGIHEWMEFFVIQSGEIGAFITTETSLLRLSILAASFLALMTYGILAVRSAPNKLFKWMLAGLGTLSIYIIIIVTCTLVALREHDNIPWFRLTDALTRYLLAVPGTMLATLGLFFQVMQTKKQGRDKLASYLQWTAAGFGLYGITQIFVPPLNIFPANIINAETFLATTGIPLQLVRSVLAVSITYSLVRALQVIEQERQAQVFAAQQARLEMLEQQEALQRELLRYTVQAQEEERARIARELHDETAQVLSAFSLELATLQNLAKRNSKIFQTVDLLQTLNKRLSRGLYRLVHDLRPAQLDDLGLIPAIKFILENDCCPQGLQISFKVKGTPKRLDPLLETILFRVTQEALNNVARHADTDQATVWLEYAEERVTLRVTDAGRGFDTSAPLRPPRGWGLAGMRERVEAANGHLKLQSSPGEGTRVEVVIPLKRDEM